MIIVGLWARRVKAGRKIQQKRNKLLEILLEKDKK